MAGQAPFATSASHVAALGVKLPSASALLPGNSGTNLTVNGVSLFLPSNFTDRVSEIGFDAESTSLLERKEGK